MDTMTSLDKRQFLYAEFFGRMRGRITEYADNLRYSSSDFAIDVQEDFREFDKKLSELNELSDTREQS